MVSFRLRLTCAVSPYGILIRASTILFSGPQAKHTFHVFGHCSPRMKGERTIAVNSGLVKALQSHARVGNGAAPKLLTTIAKTEAGEYSEARSTCSDRGKEADRNQIIKKKQVS